jgi:hypothetical protein
MIRAVIAKISLYGLVLAGSFELEAHPLYSTPWLISDEMEEIIDYNRKTLSMVPTWLDEESLRNSLTQYGLPQIAIETIDLDMGFEASYSDALAYLSRFLNKKIQYLEVGVSVGKNFFQICNYLKESQLVGFDLEMLNGSVERFLTNRKELKSWGPFEKVPKPFDHEAMRKRYSLHGNWLEEQCLGLHKVKQTASSLHRYRYEQQGNDVFYLSSDLFDERGWQQLADQGFKFNLLFSDAYHHSDAVLYEYEMLKYYELIDEEEFIMVWDDLSVVYSGFEKIWHDLKSRFPGQVIKLEYPMRGWLGIHEDEIHYVGIIVKHKEIE